MFLIDAHCHINSDQLRANAPQIIQRARDAGVGYMLVAGSDLATSAEAVKLAHDYEAEGLYAAAGVHPHDAKTVAEGILPEALLNLASDPRVVAIGEAGLDYHYDHSPRDTQKKVFRLQIDWASRTGKPLVIHVRSGTDSNPNSDAMADALKILEDAPARNMPLMFHCYAGGLEYLNAMRDLDAYLSIGGPVTWPKGGELREVASRIPEDRLLCETDSPWLAPVPRRGKLNEPAFVRFVYDEIAKVRGVSVQRLAQAVDANAARLFGWPALTQA